MGIHASVGTNPRKQYKRFAIKRSLFQNHDTLECAIPQSHRATSNQQQPVGRNNQQPINRPQGSIHHSSFVIQHWQCNSTANPLTANSQQLTIHMRPRRSHWEYTDCAPTMLGGAAPNPATYYPHTSPPPRAATSSPHVVRGKNRKVSR